MSEQNNLLQNAIADDISEYLTDEALGGTGERITTPDLLDAMATYGVQFRLIETDTEATEAYTFSVKVKR